MATTRLILVRHGESKAQETGRFYGHECIGLSDRGRWQVEALRDRWAQTAKDELGRVDVLYSSIMQRAVETAEIVAPVLGVSEILQECDLCEVHPGDADGLSWQEIDERWPQVEGAFPNPAIPNVESWAEMSVRVERTLETIAERHAGQTVVIACHGGVVAHSMNAHIGLDPLRNEKAWFMADNASITEWALDPDIDDWRQGRWGLRRYNDHSHTIVAGAPRVIGPPR